MLDFKSILKMATVSLKINKMRSMLTSLGIIIGVSAVIIMLAVGSGASKKIAKDMESMGSNLLMIRSASAKSGGLPSRSPLPHDDDQFPPAISHTGNDRSPDSPVIPFPYPVSLLLNSYKRIKKRTRYSVFSFVYRC